MLSAINALIVRVQDQDELFRESCRIAVEAGQLRMAWIGVLPAGKTTLIPLAWAGHEAGYLKHVAAAVHDMEDNTVASATGEALRTMQPAVWNNLAEYPDTVTLNHEALARGYQAIAIFPLDSGNNDRTVMGLYAAEQGFFDEEEMRLLTELAGDISYAIRNLLKQDELDYLSLYDPQTGLLNRNSFQLNMESMLEKAGADNSMLTLALCYINQYRYINNMYGLDVGDRLLREMGVRLKTLTDNPTHIARVGENTIALIFRYDKATTATRFEQVLPTMLSTPFSIDGTDIPVSVTAGMSAFPDDAGTVDELYQRAEIALERAVDSGSTYRLFEPVMDAGIIEGRELRADLGTALDNDEFVLHYQPKIDLTSGRMSGVEALIRWNHPQQGQLPPSDFIPLLEQSGQILAVDNWIFDRAVHDWQEWKK
ncbi:MAG: diguanylate cyclase, partial [Gammaproteobacteria bacterium]